MQGTLFDLMILKTLHAIGPLHGFGMAQQLSEHVLQLNEGTVYTSLLRLQQEGWISQRRGVRPRTIGKQSSIRLRRAG